MALLVFSPHPCQPRRGVTVHFPSTDFAGKEQVSGPRQLPGYRDHHGVVTLFFIEELVSISENCAYKYPKLQLTEPYLFLRS